MGVQVRILLVIFNIPCCKCGEYDEIFFTGDVARKAGLVAAAASCSRFTGANRSRVMVKTEAGNYAEACTFYESTNDRATPLTRIDHLERGLYRWKSHP